MVHSSPSDSEKILKTYEHTLAPLFSEISLIKELPLRAKDVEQVEGALRDLIRIYGPASVTEFLSQVAPCTLACFLVWKGILSYDQGNYWSGVCEAVELPRQNWPHRWGEVFEKVLRHYRLPTFTEERSLRFVAPILIHGGIPNYCLKDFFEKLVWPTTTGKLYYDNGIDDLLAQWETSSFRYHVDKPVSGTCQQL